MKDALRNAAAAGDAPAGRRPLRDTAMRYVDARLAATRRVVEFGAFERLFSLWHALHLPLFLMLLIAGVVHVVAVHLYPTAAGTCRWTRTARGDPARRRAGGGQCEWCRT